MKRLLLLTFSTAIIVLALSALGYSTFAEYYLTGGPWEEAASMDEVVQDVLATRAQEIEQTGDVDFGDDHEINVLVLGLDSRKANLEPHCDSIHMFTLNIDDWTMNITSVPRGTYSYIPPGTYAENEYYLANACSFAGLDYGIEQIEKVVGVKADYIVTAGFSQVIGILRILDLPTTESLQWLRHRQSYAIGDPQRSQNQATFMKDIIVSQSNKLRGDLGTPLFYILYSIVDTDMDYDVALALLDGYLESEIDGRPDDITFAMKPYYATQELHLDFDNPDEQIDKLLSYIRPYLSDEDLSDRPIEEVQAELVAYLNDRLTSATGVADIVDKRLWLQVEDDGVREQLHYAFIERYARDTVDADPDAVIDLLTEYIFEMQLLGEQEYVDMGTALLGELIRVEV